jgi:N-dimethylarginine dimethylaminohydrolase
VVSKAALVRLSEGFVEGGDVLVDRDTVLCGVGERTDHAGATALGLLLPDGVALQAVPLAEGVLHLDTAVGLAPGLAFVWRDGLAEPDDVVRYLETRGEVLEVDVEEARGFATNFLMLGPTVALIPAGVPRVAALFAARGIEAVELAFDEHHRSGGSIRCATLPLRRTGEG